MPDNTGFARLVSTDQHLQRAFTVARECARTGHPILLIGETGTGKRLLAQALQEELEIRGPFLVEDARELDYQRFASLAPESVLFVRNTAGLDRETQQGLLNALRGPERTAMARLLFSATPDLPAHIGSGAFLPELYYCLAACEIRLPPLRSRSGDLPVLIEHFAQTYGARLGRSRIRVDIAFIDRFSGYSFPGNVTELKTVVHKAIHWAQNDRLTGEIARVTLDNHAINRIADQLIYNQTEPLRRMLFPAELPTVAEAKRQLIVEALRRTEGNQSKAARILGLTPPAINKFLNRMDVSGE